MQGIFSKEEKSCFTIGLIFFRITRLFFVPMFVAVVADVAVVSNVSLVADKKVL